MHFGASEKGPYLGDGDTQYKMQGSLHFNT